jgi:hypothetical protein
VLEEIAGSNKQRATQSVLNAALNKSRDAEEIGQLRRKLRASYERFMVHDPFFALGLPLTLGQVTGQIRHDISLASVVEAQALSNQAIFEGHSRYDAVLGAIAEAQARSEQAIPSLISEGHIRHDAALGAITASQTRHDQILPMLLSDADRGMSSRHRVSRVMLKQILRGSKVFVAYPLCPSRLELSAVWMP